MYSEYMSLGYMIDGYIRSTLAYRHHYYMQVPSLIYLFTCCVLYVDVCACPLRDFGLFLLTLLCLLNLT